MYNWLSYGSDEYLSRREFSFTMDEIYSRYNSFLSMEAMKAEIIKKNPDKFDIGAVYNISVSN
jgi:DNA primase small subunit